MLSISAMTAGQHHYYANLSREDYFLQGGEPPGRWLGIGAKRLELRDPVEKGVLSRLFAGLRPDGESLIQIQKGRDHQPGWDLTFSAPKSVSVEWAIAPSELRDAIEKAHGEAVKEAIAYLEEEASWTRRGSGGERAEKAGLIVAAFDHGTSRAQDPQLHTHCLVLNVASREDGTFGTLRSHDIYEHKMAAGALYRAELGSRLVSLGFKLEAGEHSFEIRGVPKALLEEFSKRRAAIEEELETRGESGPEASERAARLTRRTKEHISREELFGRWRSTGRKHGFSAKETVFEEPRRQRSYLQDEKLIRRETLSAAERLTKHHSTFSESRILHEVTTSLEEKGIRGTHIREGVRKALQADEIVPLFQNRDYQVFTTRDMYAVEKSLLEIAERSKESTHHEVSDGIIEKVLKTRPTLTDEQKDALRHITQGKGTIVCLDGLAGTGKSYLLDSAREVWTKAGFQVVGTALSGQAARELYKSSEIPTRTVASLLWHIDRPLKDTLKHHGKMLVRAAVGAPTWRLPKLQLGRNTILVVDEAGMVGTRDLERLLRLAEKAGAKVVLSGDTRQLQPIAAGGPLRALIERLGAAKLVEIVRQHEEWMRDAVRMFVEGDSRGALTQYALAERLHVASSKVDAMKRLIASWSKGKSVDLKDSLILSGTKDDTEKLNHLAQEKRRSELGRSATFQGKTYFVKDRIVFTKTNKKYGIVNGDRGTIERIRWSYFHREVTVRLDVKDKKGRPIRVTFFPKDYSDFDLGYASTVHKAQGSTIDRSYVLAGGWIQDREMSYVQMSRARERTEIFASEVTAGEDLSNLVHEMAQSRKKEIAHDVKRRLEETMYQRRSL